MPGPARCAPSMATTSVSSRPISPPIKGKYFTGDGCRRDEDGYYWITGRVDDVINVSGHRMGTAEVESRARRPSQSVGGRGRRLSARHQGTGHLCLCHADGGRGADGRAARIVALGAQGDRPDRLARPDPVRVRACRRRAPARSCGASCARSPRTNSAISAIPRRSPIPRVVDDLVKNRQNRKGAA